MLPAHSFGCAKRGKAGQGCRTGNGVGRGRGARMLYSEECLKGN